MPTLTAATDTAELVLIAVLERREHQARVLRDRVARIVTEQRAAAPDEPLSHDADLWRHGAYVKWSEAWEALTSARKALAGLPTADRHARPEWSSDDLRAAVAVCAGDLLAVGKLAAAPPRQDPFPHGRRAARVCAASDLSSQPPGVDVLDRRAQTSPQT